jgi:uncharacterized protein
VRLVVLADTHLRARSARDLPRPALALLETADGILHAGDVLDPGTLERISAIAPTWAVLGNNDVELAGLLPQTRLLDLGGVRVAMVHDSGASHGRAARLHRRFAEADVVVFGHSHQPLIAPGEAGQLLLNPGSPTQRRAAPNHTVAILELSDGQVTACRLELVDP